MSAEVGLYRVDFKDGSYTEGSAIEIDKILGKYDNNDSLAVPFELLQELTDAAINSNPSLKTIEQGFIASDPETGFRVYSPLSLFAKEHPFLAALIAFSLIGTTAALAAGAIDDYRLTSRDLRLNLADDKPIQEGDIQTSLTNPEQTQYQPDNPDNIAISNYEEPWSLQTFGDLGLTGEGAKVVVLDTGTFTSRLENQGVGIVIDARRPLGEYELCNQPPAPDSNCGRDFYFHGAKTTTLIDSTSPDAQIINIAVLNGNGDTREQWIQNAADIIAQKASDSQGPIIVNMSFGWGGDIRQLPPGITESMSSIINNPNVLVVASAGNNYSSGCDWPQSDFAQMLNSGAVNILENQRIEMRPSSSWGTNCVDLVAPGGGLLFLTDSNGELIIDRQTNEPIPLGGTSFAAPQITGLAALFIQASENTATPEQLTNLILATTRPLTANEYLPVETLTRNAFTPHRIINTPSILFGYGIPEGSLVLDAVEHLPDYGFPVLTTLQIEPFVIIGDKDASYSAQAGFQNAFLEIIGADLTREISIPENGSGAATVQFYSQNHQLGRLTLEQNPSPFYLNIIRGKTTTVLY